MRLIARLSPRVYTASRKAMMPPKFGRLFSFGVIADVQYGDKESRLSGSRPESLMNYRQGIFKLSNAVEAWFEKKQELSFVLNLGDIIDGQDTKEESLDDFHSVMKPFNQLHNVLPVYHVIGNHCLRVPRNTLYQALNIDMPYYSIKIEDQWKLIVLDTNDLGPLAHGEEQIEESKQFLESNPPEKNLSSQRWNGGIASAQLSWLKDELDKCKSLNEHVIVACHHPVGDGSARETHMAWNHLQIQSVILESGIVSLVMSGHDHPGGYSVVQGTHFITLRGVVEAPGNEDAYGIIDVYPEGIMLNGFGCAQTIWMSHQNLIQTN